jgi:hypothetical protein
LSKLCKKKGDFMKVFGDVDRSKDGKVKSDYPSWYFNQQKDELRESIIQKERAIEMDIVPPENKGEFRSMMESEKKKLDMIEESQPKLSEVELDKVSKIRKTLGDKVRDAMFSRSQMDRGVADPHEEARRISEYCIKLDTGELEFVKSCDVPISNTGMVSRLSAEKSWKIASKLIGEMSNTEMLRKP